jgi:DNA-binding PadR family transcriptional regulator
MTEDEANDARLAYYLEIGAVSFEGVDESGEIIYSISDNAKELAPELWQSHTNYVDKSLMELYEQGLVEVEYNENLEATLHITPEGQKVAREKGLIEMDLDQDIPND